MCQWLTNIFFHNSGTTEEVVSSSTESNIENNHENEESMETENNVYNGIVILLDNGHGESTPGKRSYPMDDGYVLREYEFNRDIVKRIAKKLSYMGINFRILVPERDIDVSLKERVNRANKYCNEFGKDKCLFISVHANAAQVSDKNPWSSARGWSVYTTIGETQSDKYATIFFEEAEKILPNYNMTLRKQMSDGDPDYEENFYVIYHTVCPAILTENLFFTNKIDCNFLRSDEGRDVIAQIHINAIKRICGLD